jgi:hypothetical protein
MVTAVDCRRLLDHVDVCLDAIYDAAVGASATPGEHWAACTVAFDQHDRAYRAMHAAMQAFEDEVRGVAHG